MRALLAFSLISLGTLATASEGKWTPSQVLELSPAWLREQGLKVPPQKLWDAKEGTGLLAAAVNLSGCSAAFVSETGLVLTNHHCLFGILQQHSTPEKDLIRDGYLARTAADELPGTGERLYVPRKFTDVTQEVLSAIPAGIDDLGRYRAVERRQRELEKACERPPQLRCEVQSFDDGSFFVRVESVELADLRLVYAPPNAVGDYGGEIDNWSWPRHAGDFAIARAYVAKDGSPHAYDKDNVPYHPRFFLPLSTDGVAPGDFVAVLGYPGFTWRSVTAKEMEERAEHSFPASEAISADLIRILEEVSRKDDAARIAVAGTLKGLRNRIKNLQGQLAGVRRWHVVERQRAQEEEIVKWASGKREWRDALAARDELGALADDKLRTAQRDLMLRGLWGCKALSMSTTLVRMARERQKPELEREPEFLDRELPQLREELERAQKTLSLPAERQVLAYLVGRNRALPADQRVAALDQFFGDAQGAELDARIERLLNGTKVLELAEQRRMADETPEQLRARADPALEIGAGLADSVEKMIEDGKRRSGGAYRLRPAWRKAVVAHAGRPVAPDANGTLRISFAKVMGYAPRDGVAYQPQTTLAGLLEKETGKEPFQIPPKIKEAAARSAQSRWRDRKLGDIPVDFLSDADTTGGNSGSPVIDGRGRLVGINFDRVWENVSNDFAYNPITGRNISVDARYLLWHLEEVAGARELLGELGIKPAAR